MKSEEEPGAWGTVAVVGVGLIGASFARAIRKAGFPGTLLGVSSPATVRKALDLGIIDKAVPLDQAAAQADLIYLSQTISAILDTLERLDNWVRPGTLITDAGSTKARIIEKAAKFIRRGFFIGGHPMAGKESRGPESSEPDLFRDQPYILTPVQPSDLETPQAQELMRWISRIGARLVTVEPKQHDRWVAYTSHLPQLLSTALAATVGAVEGASALRGPAVLDLTRLALSPFEVWRDIFATNREHVDEALGVFIGELQQMRQDLTAPGMERQFARATEVARDLRKVK